MNDLNRIEEIQLALNDPACSDVSFYGFVSLDDVRYLLSEIDALKKELSGDEIMKAIRETKAQVVTLQQDYRRANGDLEILVAVNEKRKKQIEELKKENARLEKQSEEWRLEHAAVAREFTEYVKKERKRRKKVKEKKVNPDCPRCNHNKRVIFMQEKKFSLPTKPGKTYRCEVYKCNACSLVIDISELFIQAEAKKEARLKEARKLIEEKNGVWSPEDIDTLYRLVVEEHGENKGQEHHLKIMRDVTGIDVKKIVDLLYQYERAKEKQDVEVEKGTDSKATDRLDETKQDQSIRVG